VDRRPGTGWPLTRVRNLVYSARGGFTVIELVATLAVTALLVAVGVSAYRTHVVRDQVAATVVRSEVLQARVAEAFRRLGMPPRDTAEAGISPEAPAMLGGHIEALTVIDGRIEVTFGSGADPAISGERLSLTPFETVSREIVWVCGNKVPDLGLEPLGFSGGARQAVQVLTTVDARYLPSSCR
jgi:type IV pilus assembly protein PilA